MSNPQAMLEQVEITTKLVDSMKAETADAPDGDAAFKEFQELIRPAIILGHVTSSMARAIYHKAFHDGYKHGVDVTRKIHKK